MKTVFILGAGASRAAGGPLMSDFLDYSEKLIRLKRDGVIQAKKAFDDVFDALGREFRLFTQNHILILITLRCFLALLKWRK